MLAPLLATTQIDSAVSGFVGAITGAAIALSGQLLARRSESRDQWLDQLLNDCATIYQLEDVFLAAMSHAVRRAAEERLEGWRREERAHAGAELEMLSPSRQLVALARDLNTSGRQLWHDHRNGALDEKSREGRFNAHRQLLDRFVEEASKVLRSRRRTWRR